MIPPILSGAMAGGGFQQVIHKDKVGGRTGLFNIQ
jgi:hypothetical protein